MIVGYMGDVPFITSRNYLVTFDNYTRSSDGRWAKHDIVGSKPVLEYLGPDTEKISLKIRLRRDHGVRPESLLKKLRSMRDTGEAFPLVIGSRVIGDAFLSLLTGRPLGSSSGLWVLKSINEGVTHWAGGNIYVVDVDISLEEYAGRLM